jgi:hypothetical protein
VYTAYHGTENRVIEVCVFVPSCRVLLPSPLRLSSAEYTKKRANNSDDRPSLRHRDEPGSMLHAKMPVCGVVILLHYSLLKFRMSYSHYV